MFDELRRICPADAVLVEETPSNLGDLHAAWPITQPDAFYTMASGGLGWSVPASVGIALAERDSGRNRPVVMVVGDGSFQYSLQSIWTAAQLKLPIVFIVLRNGEYAILKAFAEVEDSPGVPGLDIPGIDIVASPGDTAATRPARTASTCCDPKPPPPLSDMHRRCLRSRSPRRYPRYCDARRGTRVSIGADVARGCIAAGHQPDPRPGRCDRRRPRG